MPLKPDGSGLPDPLVASDVENGFADKPAYQPPSIHSRPPRAGVLVASMWVAYALNYADRQMVFSIFPILKAELKLSDTQLGLTGSIFLWIYALCSPIAGQIVDRFSKRAMVVSSLVLWSGVTALTGLSTSAFMLIGSRALMGITESLFIPAAITLVAGAFDPTRRSRAMALFGTAQLAGVVLGGSFGSFMAQEFHWRAAFAALGLFGMLYAIPYVLFLKNTGGEAEADTRKSGGAWAIAALWKVPSYRWLCVIFAVFMFPLWLLYTWLPQFFYDRFSMTLASAGFTATVYVQASTFIGTLVGGAMADRLYRRTKSARFRLVCAGLLVCSPCLYLLGNSESLLSAKLAALGFGFGSGLFMANLMVSSFEVVPADTRGSAVGFLNLIGGLVSGGAALLGGMAKASVGLQAMMSYAAVACLGAGLMLVFAIRGHFQRDYERVH